jgi:hypothetical protein
MPTKLRETSAFSVLPAGVGDSLSLDDAKVAYADLLRAACELGASPLTARDLSEQSNGAMQLDTLNNYLTGKSAPPRDDAHSTLVGLIGTTLTLKGFERAPELKELKRRLDVAYHAVKRARRRIRPQPPEVPCTTVSSSTQVAALAAMQVGADLELAIEHLVNFGLPILFASWDGFAENEALAHDMFARLKPMDFGLLSQVAPLGMEPGRRIVNGFAELAKARRLLEDSLPSGGVVGVLLRAPWTEERDVKFKAHLSAALDDLRVAATLCKRAGITSLPSRDG